MSKCSPVSARIRSRGWPLFLAAALFAVPARAETPKAELGCDSLPPPQEEKKIKEDARKECPVLNGQLRGYPGAEEGSVACARAHISILGARKEICAAITEAETSALKVPTANPDAKAEDKALDLVKGSAVEVHKAIVKTEDARVLLKLRSKEVEKAQEKLKAGAERQKQSATTKTAFGTSAPTPLAHYQTGLRELDRIRAKLDRYLGYADTAKENFGRTHQALLERVPGSLNDKLAVTTLNRQTSQQSMDLEAKPANDAKYIGDRAKGTALASGARIAGVSTVPGRAAAANAAGATIGALTGDTSGAATATAAQILGGTAKDSAVGGVQTVLKAVPIAGGAAATGVGAAVTVLTNPTTANEPEVAPERVVQQTANAGITYNNGIDGDRPLNVQAGKRVGDLQEQYGGASPK